ncbi:hypothetical protein BVX97_04190 [bacterium E08(2017)]|nr:hypothetical protein BVX97_04190 [bacterium E08(2017)]
MCGRYTLTKLSEDDARALGITLPTNLIARYNIAPSQVVPVIRTFSPSNDRILDQMRWGLSPSWMGSAPSKPKPINTRAETILEKPMFRKAFVQRRCIIPADGYYEWKKTSSGKQPYYFTNKDNTLLCFAGIWETAADESPTFSIITTSPNSVAAKIHNRMPVILDSKSCSTWLGINDAGVSKLTDLLVPSPDDSLVCHPVSRAVNSPANDSPECIREQTSEDRDLL